MEQYLPYAVLGLLGIILFVLCILSARAWKIVHIMLLIMVFIAMGATMSMLSAAYRTRSDWINRATKNEAAAEKQTAALNEAIYGPEDAVSLVDNCLLGVNARLQIELQGQGRVWKIVKPEAAANNEATIKFPNSPAGTAGQIGEDMLLYVFKNRSINVGSESTPQSVPANYLATVRVTRSANDEIVVEGLFVVNQQEFENKNATWTLFERMPLDSHTAFRKAFGITQSPDAPDLDAAQYINDFRGQLKAFMPKPDNMDEDAYESLIDRYVFDGMRKNEIEKWMADKANNPKSRVFDPADHEYFHKLKFKKAITKQIDDTSQSLDNSEAIDALTGHAVDPKLKGGDENGMVTVPANSSGFYDVASYNANKVLLNNADAEIQYTVYRRELIDFPGLIEKTRNYSAELTLQVGRLNENIKLSQQSNADLKTQQATRSSVYNGLSNDNKNLTEDLASIRDLLNKTQEELDNTRQSINDLYADISQKHKEVNLKSRALLQKKTSTGSGGQ